MILGEVGRNFGAGMSGGIAHVLDKNESFRSKCKNPELNLLEVVDEEDISSLKEHIENHYNSTSSLQAQEILEKWEYYLPKFIKVYPEEYKRALERLEEEKLSIQN